MGDDSSFCLNCKRSIPSFNYVMHSMHCSRNITLCTLCEEPVPHSEMDAHQIEFHSVKECESCGEKLDISQLQMHKIDSCPLRRINCSICELELAASEIFEHENYCGSRTELCEECGEYVMLKYQKLHIESNHTFLKLDDEPGPTPSWQTHDRGSMNGIGTVNNDLRYQRKVMNSDSGIGAFGRNSLFMSSSPSKRTNDMPQVNSVPHTSKSVYKAAITGDSDKTLRNLNAGDSVDSDVAVLLTENLHLKKSSHPRLSSLTHTTYSQEEDLVALPCEFCEALVPANQLILHQTACRPDLAQYDGEFAASPMNGHLPTTSGILDKHSRMFSANPRAIHNNLMTSSSGMPLSRREISTNIMDETLLPCEFCHDFFSVGQLYDHQTHCTLWLEDLNPNGQKATVPDQSQINPLQNRKSGLHDTAKNLECGPSKVIHKEDVKLNVRRNRFPKEIKTEPATCERGVRDLRQHSLEMEKRTQKSKLWPSDRMQPRLKEEDEERVALLNKARMMDRISSQMCRMKETSASRNAALQETPPQLTHHPKLPNFYSSDHGSSCTRGSYQSSSSHPQSGRGGLTMGAIPKQKSKSLKKCRAPLPPSTK